ncbi:FHA domain-containing protein [Streptomyces sp. NPDC050504]|uniref:FHA domain-containing protein n=1 Tax=Streptomyces sp. NPDC050504 TaxID=3365618 RepID=UPI0037AFAD11
MQIRLTVLAPRSGQAAARACDVLVTAPAGTALAAVASGLTAAVSGAAGAGTGAAQEQSAGQGRGPSGGGSIGGAAGVAGVTGSSGAVVLYAGRERLDAQRCALGEPPLIDGAVLSLQVPGDEEAPARASGTRLHVVAGPDAGGVHLLHGGQIRIGRSADADVPLNDPDVSRLHCAVTVREGGRVTVQDLGSTNGTVLDGSAVGERAVRLSPGALLRLGESALRLVADDPAPALDTAPDGEGHLRVTVPEAPGTQHGGIGGIGVQGGQGAHGAHGAQGPDSDVYGAQGAAAGTARPYAAAPTPPRGTRTPAEPESRRRGGIGAWARRLAGGRGEQPTHEAVPDLAHPGGGPGGRDAGHGAATGPRTAQGERAPWAGDAGSRGGDGTWADDSDRDAPAKAASWPDPAAVLLTALGPGPRLWERAPGHQEELVVRLGTGDRADLPSVPVTVGLREAGALGLAGPRERLTGLARSVVAQIAALHPPTALEIVLISTDRARSAEERGREWGWLGWLPHVRPAHGQDCRLLLAYDRDQALARTAELTRRLDDGPLGSGWASAERSAVAEAAARYAGPRTVVVVDGDPGSAALRETTARLAAAGAAAGIHLVCLAETPAASPVSPVAATYESACAASLAFRECGAVAILSGDVATALRLLRTAGGRPAGHGTVGSVDAVSAAWAERFARALAPLRAEGAGVLEGHRAAVALPRSARLLDELGLARATPASLMARWASAADAHGTPVPGAPAQVVLGAGPRGALSVDLTDEGPHLLIEGPPGSGRTELLRSVAASLASAARPDRLGLILVDGAGGERGGEGLRPCTELPHVFTHLVASDPVRMREFAQSLGAELKRRAELLGRQDFAEWHTGREVSDRMVGQRTGSEAATHGTAAARGTSPHGTVTHSAGTHSSTTAHGTGTHSSAAAHGTGTHTSANAHGSATAHGTGTGTGTQGTAAYGTGTHGAGTGAHGTAAYGSVGGRGAGGPYGSGESPQAAASVPAPGSAPIPAPGSAPEHARGHTSGLGIGRGGAAPGTATTGDGAGAADLEAPPSGTVRLRTASAARSQPVPGPAPLPRLVVLVDDFDALVAPALGAPGRPAAGSVVRALEAVARDGDRLGVHLVATSARPERTRDTELAQRTRLRAVLDAPVTDPAPDDPAPGRGRLGHPDGRVTPFQGGRVTGRIPRTATQRPTVVPLEWERMGDPPTRRPVRELGNGPTDLALLASALDRAARSVDAAPIPPLTPVIL